MPDVATPELTTTEFVAGLLPSCPNRGAPMLDCAEIPRVKSRDVGDYRELIRNGQPVVIEEQDNKAFRRLASSWTDERILSTFHNLPWRVVCSERGKFDIQVPFALQTKVMPFSEFYDKIQHPEERFDYYFSVSPGVAPPRAPGTPDLRSSADLLGAQMAAARPLIEEARELGRAMPMTRYRNQDLCTIWMGGARHVTPLHYDDQERSHGVIRGQKLCILFPPDLSHLRNLYTLPMLSPAGWYSALGAHPFDTNLFPRLKRTRPQKTLLGPGDFLYIPPAWWHHISIPSELTISVSAAFRSPRIYFYWYYWRLRLMRRLKRQAKLFERTQATARTIAGISEAAGRF